MIKKNKKVLESIKNLITDKKELVIFLALVLLVYFLIRFSITLIGILAVLEFAILMFMVGLAPAFLFRKVLPFKNIIGWFINASALGVLLTPFIFLIFGWMGLNFVFTHSISVLFILAMIGIIYLLVFIKQKDINVFINFNYISIIDIFFYSIILSLTVILSLQNFSSYYPRWDAFTFWGLDAKYIFDFNQLRNAQFDVVAPFHQQSSFFPIILSIIYDIFGKIVEQYASWVNVYLHFLSALVVYNLTLKKNVLLKLVTVTIFIILTYIIDSIAYNFSLYADTLSAFFLLLFARILTATRNFNDKPKQYLNRFLLLTFIAFALYFVKRRFFILSCILTFLVFLYDIKYWYRNWKKIILNPKFFIVIIILIAIWFLHINYQSTLKQDFQFSSGVSIFFRTKSRPFISFVNYAKQVFELLIIRSFHLSVLFITSILLILMIDKPLKNREFLFIYFLTIGIVFKFVFAFINRQAGLESESLIRYTSVVMYLVPLLVNKMHFSKQQRLLRGISTNDMDHFSMVMISILIFISFSVLNSIKNQSLIFQRGINIVQGTYREPLKEFSDLADKVLAITGEDARIIIADDANGGILMHNVNAPTIYVRYFLMYNSVGGQFRKPIGEFLQFAKAKSPDYILLLSHENSFSECESLFEKGHNYLIEFDSNMIINEDACMFSDYDIYKLSGND